MVIVIEHLNEKQNYVIIMLVTKQKTKRTNLSKGILYNQLYFSKLQSALNEQYSSISILVEQ